MASELVVTRRVYPQHGRRLLLLLVSLGPLAVAPPVHAAKAVKQQCIKAACVPQRIRCVESFLDSYRTARADCASERAEARKLCRAAERRTFRQNRRTCTAGFKQCRRQCDSAGSQMLAGSYLDTLPTWNEFSPPQPALPPTRVGEPVQTQETIDDVPVVDPADNSVLGYRSELYQCASTRFTVTDTPEKIVMLSPDREFLWPGGMIQGKSHRDGVGALLPLTIRERSPIKVSIPSLATEDNFRLVLVPDQAEVTQAIGSMIYNATTDDLVTPSAIQFFMKDYSSDDAFALSVGVSAKYLGFQANASTSVTRTANERTVMVYFLEKMFEVVVEPPETPGAFFSDAFTQALLDQQISLGKLGPANPPLYISNVVYGRTMAFTFTSTATASEIKAALNAAYKGIFSASLNLSVQQKKVLEEGKIAITSLGGQAKATEAMIASGDWRQYFTEKAPLTSAYPISYTFRNLRDGSIASVAESTEYTVKECSLTDAAFSGFVLDSFESANDVDHCSDETSSWCSTGPPVELTWGPPETPQSIFYGYAHAKHTNASSSDNTFLYDVGYLVGPPHFLADKSDFYKGELSFWFRPDDTIYGTTTGTYCYCDLSFLGICLRTKCVPVEQEDARPLDVGDKVFAYDDVTTFDQVVIRGGTPPFSVLTLTYNPDQAEVPIEWSRFEVSLTNDAASNSRCNPADPAKRGCWLVEDDVASEEEIKYVLANVLDFRIRASYPIHHVVCTDDPPPAPGTSCGMPEAVPFGYVGGFFDEVKLNKKTAGL